jgi:hypothetical protein
MGLFGSLIKGVMKGGNPYAMAQNAVVAEYALIVLEQPLIEWLFTQSCLIIDAGFGGGRSPESNMKFFYSCERLVQLNFLAMAMDERGLWPKDCPGFIPINNLMRYADDVTTDEIKIATANVERECGHFIQLKSEPLRIEVFPTQLLDDEDLEMLDGYSNR